MHTKETYSLKKKNTKKKYEYYWTKIKMNQRKKIKKKKIKKKKIKKNKEKK